MSRDNYPSLKDERKFACKKINVAKDRSFVNYFSLSEMFLKVFETFIYFTKISIFIYEEMKFLRLDFFHHQII